MSSAHASPVLRRFRIIALAEGFSWLALLVAMYLKYGMHHPEATKIPGWIHGLLFVSYIATAVPLFTKLKWPGERLYGVIAAGFLPFGTFVLERKWLR